MRRKAQRYIFKTKGVCAPEIHFQVDRGALSEIRFVGGGCPGHAGFVSQLLKAGSWTKSFGSHRASSAATARHARTSWRAR